MGLGEGAGDGDGLVVRVGAGGASVSSGEGETGASETKGAAESVRSAAHVSIRANIRIARIRSIVFKPCRLSAKSK